MIGVVYTGFSGANVFGVPIGTMIGDAIGWRFTFLFIIVSVIAGVLMMVYLPSTSELNQVQRQWGSTSNKQLNTSKILRPVEVVKYLAITFNFSSKFCDICLY